MTLLLDLRGNPYLGPPGDTSSTTATTTRFLDSHAATDRFAIKEMLLVVEWGGSPVNLIHWALALGRPRGHISVMCALDSEREAPVRLPSGRARAVDAKWRQTALRVIDETCAQLRAGGLAADPVYRDGPADEAIMWAATEQKAELVITTAAFADQVHGRALSRAKHMGRTSFLFVRASPDRRAILVADDLSDASRHARLLSSLAAGRLNAPLHVTSADDSFDVTATAVRARSGTLGIRAAELLGTNPPAMAIADQILAVAEEQDVQLVVVGNHRRGLWGRLFFGSVSDDIAKYARTSVLVATPEAA